jgi:hypothetical protein
VERKRKKEIKREKKPVVKPLGEKDIISITLNMDSVCRICVPSAHQFKDNKARTGTRYLAKRAPDKSTEQPGAPTSSPHSLPFAPLKGLLIGVVV